MWIKKIIKFMFECKWLINNIFTQNCFPVFYYKKEKIYFTRPV